MSSELATALQSALSLDTAPVVTSTRGGDTASAWLAELADQRWFMKSEPLSRHVGFEAEAYNLERLAAGPLVVPQVIALGSTRTMHWMALEFLDLQRLSAATAAALGEGLATLHDSLQHDRYGWPSNNQIGRSPQQNQWSSDWGQFFATQRLAPLVRQLATRMSRESHDELMGLVVRAPDWLRDHRPTPVLLHGDLWGGNAAAARVGDTLLPAVYDPACYFGDREADIAMTELFGGFPESFYQRYQQTWPLPAGYPERRDLYNLYHVLNHAVLFGGSYLQQTQMLVSRLLQVFS